MIFYQIHKTRPHKNSRPRIELEHEVKRTLERELEPAPPEPRPFRAGTERRRSLPVQPTLRFVSVLEEFPAPCDAGIDTVDGARSRGGSRRNRRPTSRMTSRGRFPEPNRNDPSPIGDPDASYNRVRFTHQTLHQTLKDRRPEAQEYGKGS